MHQVLKHLSSSLRPSMFQCSMFSAPCCPSLHLCLSMPRHAGKVTWLADSCSPLASFLLHSAPLLGVALSFCFNLSCSQRQPLLVPFSASPLLLLPPLTHPLIPNKSPPLQYLSPDLLLGKHKLRHKLIMLINFQPPWAER